MNLISPSENKIFLMILFSKKGSKKQGFDTEHPFLTEEILIEKSSNVHQNS